MTYNVFGGTLNHRGTQGRRGCTYTPGRKRKMFGHNLGGGLVASAPAPMVTENCQSTKYYLFSSVLANRAK